jgi:hypothetical protein
MLREVFLGIHTLVILFIALGFPYGLLTNKPNFRKFHAVFPVSQICTVLCKKLRDTFC